MPVPATVVISCAGMGRRLGLSKTKALVEICGRPLIAWQLDALRWVSDLRVVVGYQAQDVIDCVRAIRQDVIFAFNREYQTTGTAASFACGALGARGLVVSLDGDLLVRPRDLQAFVGQGRPALGVLPLTSEEPLAAVLDNDGDAVVAFERSAAPTPLHLEWSGLCQITAEQLEKSKGLDRASGHVYQLLEPHLPLPAVGIDAREIDTPGDYERAAAWLNMHSREWRAE